MADKEARKKLLEERKRIEAHKAKLLKDLEKEPLVRVRFSNKEMPGVDIQFSFQGVKRYHLFDGMVYDLPRSVVNHLNNNCKVPIYKMYTAEELNSTFRGSPIDPSKRIVGYENRFVCIPENIEDLIDEKAA